MTNNTASFDVKVEEEDVLAFAKLSGDYNKLHVDADYASKTNFEKRIAHGALLIGYISRLLGMYIPGQECIINGISSKMHKPVYLGCKVTVEGSITQYNSDLKSGKVVGKIHDNTTKETYVTFVVDYSLHYAPKICHVPEIVKEIHNNSSLDNSLLVLGANGGIGSSLVKYLEKNYLIAKAGRDSEKNDHVINLAELSTIEDFAKSKTSYKSLICLASDPLISSPLVVNDNLRDGIILNSLGVVALADACYKKGMKHIIFFSSTMGDKHNLNAEFASYSLGKSILNSTVHLLSKKYAGQMEIYNIVLGNMFTGLTAGASEMKMIKYNLSTVTKKANKLEELHHLVREILENKYSSLSGNEIRLTSGL